MVNKLKPKQVSFHRKLNTALTLIVVVLGLYISLSPFVPQMGWWFRHRHPAYSMGTAKTVPPPTENHAPFPIDNLLVIPRLEMREVIHTGSSLAELNKGAWLIPHTSTPDQNSNSVIVGHRFTYVGSGVFYFLDKVEMGDTITIYWQQKEYTYKVGSIKVVPPTEISVEAPTDKPQLTLYTCTPLWTAKNRLVITADLEGVRQ